MNDPAVSQAYRDHRPYLVDLAFRMLGDIASAEDVVQDAFTRLMRVDVTEIEDVRGWLIVVTSRLALDLMRSARSRRAVRRTGFCSAAAALSPAGETRAAST